MSTIYITRGDATAAIAAAIEAGDALAAEYDLDAICDDCFTWEPSEGRLQHAGYRQHATDDDFWAAVERHAHSNFTATITDSGETDPATGGVLLHVIVTNDDGDEIDRLQYVTADPEAPEDLDDLTAQIERQGWKIISTPNDDGDGYQIARI